ncbi:proteasome subunit beta type-4-like [Homalodisca vitripennis]|uniref:proteasome subunit beta type-4-like n=1 Tax=Homalodisca vitripennis TaxID=197043 RepID=UPI001EEB95EF|nr:proteasome subunit beta type-4-like [Homalodisca vitripennis]
MAFSGPFSSDVPFWNNGPSPGCLYDFPKANLSKPNDGGFHQRSQRPITTTTSVLAMKFDGGVIMSADMLGSYGSLARFPNCPRLVRVNKNILIGASGDYADFQYLKDIIQQKIIDEDCMDDGFNLKPKSLYCWLTRVLYNRRSKFDPLWNTYVVAGLQDGEPFLGGVNMLGTAFEDSTVGTGYGAYMALPLMREAYEKKPNMSQQEAYQLLVKCMEVLYYRDGRAFNKYQIATITSSGIEITEPLSIVGNWNLANSY